MLVSVVYNEDDDDDDCIANNVYIQYVFIYAYI
jgi:hypothetical protein